MGVFLNRRIQAPRYDIPLENVWTFIVREQMPLVWSRCLACRGIVLVKTNVEVKEPSFKVKVDLPLQLRWNITLYIDWWKVKRAFSSRTRSDFLSSPSLSSIKKSLTYLNNFCPSSYSNIVFTLVSHSGIMKSFWKYGMQEPTVAPPLCMNNSLWRSTTGELIKIETNAKKSAAKRDISFLKRILPRIQNMQPLTIEKTICVFCNKRYRS